MVNWCILLHPCGQGELPGCHFHWNRISQVGFLRCARRTDGGRELGSKQRRDQSKEGRVMSAPVCSNFVSDTTVCVSVCLCALSVLQSQSGTAVWKDVVLVSSGLADAAERLIYTHHKFALLPACLGRRTMETRRTITAWRNTGESAKLAGIQRIRVCLNATSVEGSLIRHLQHLSRSI